jgi:3-methyladenine DNA glycosylase AlkD
MIDEALATLRALADDTKAAEMAAYHKAPRVYLGVTVPQITELANGWREQLSVEDRVTLADELWQSDIHEARVAATKLLTQARLRPDDGAWALIQTWVPDFDGWSLADHACDAGRRRLQADPSRIDIVEGWTTSDHMWTRRAALVITLPWTKMNFPKPEDLAIRDRVLGWAASYTTDSDWFIQKAIAWWLRDLSKHDADRSRAFLATHGEKMKPFARKEAAKYL